MPAVPAVPAVATVPAALLHGRRQLREGDEPLRARRRRPVEVGQERYLAALAQVGSLLLPAVTVLLPAVPTFRWLTLWLLP